MVNASLDQMNGLQRATESFHYVVLSIEYWISPNGHIREWLRRNVLLCAWLIVPAVFVMPVVGFILWQFTMWLSMLTGIVGKLILILLAFVAFRMIKR